MKKFLTALSIGFICVLMFNSYFESTEAALAKEIIRFHVLANSDEEHDQNLKIKVRNRIINEMNTMFDKNGDIQDARDVITENMEKIKLIAKDEIQKNGYNYDVNVSLGKSDFPTRDYGDIVLPAGSYEALKIEIGKAQGKNWWCVLFPPLCFVDESCVSCNSDVAASLTTSFDKEEAELIKKDKKPKVQLKFKTYEMWQNGKHRLAYMLGLK